MVVFQFGVLIAVCCMKAAVGIRCEGKTVNKIAEVLMEVKDWEGLGSELNAKRGTLNAIKTTCRVDAASLVKCYRRELVNWYCDSPGYELVVIIENIAKALEVLDHKQQAADLRALEFNGARNTLGDQPKSSTPSSPPPAPRESSIPPSEGEQPTQSSGNNGQPWLWEFWRALSAEIVFSVLSTLVIGFLMCCWQKLINIFYKGKSSKKDHSFPLPTPPKEKDFRQFGTPNLNQLMNLIGVTVKNKWRAIGVGLEVKETDLDSFQMQEGNKPGSAQRCMARVFQKWRSAKTSDYTWQNLVGVLESPAVDEKAAVQELYESLCKENK